MTKEFEPKYLLSIDEMTQYYDKFITEITVLQCILHTTEKDRHIPILIHNVIDVNRCFTKNFKLLEEVIISKAIIRNQLQNLVYLYAESKYPSKVIEPVFTKGRVFSKLKIPSPSFTTYLKELSPVFEDIEKVWENSCNFVHPQQDSYIFSLFEYSVGLLEKEIPNLNDSLKEIINDQKHRKQTTLQYDFYVMYRLNLIIYKLLKNLIKEMVDKITSNENQSRIYQSIKKNKEIQSD